MFSRSFSLTLKVCALLVLPVLIAAGALLFGPGDPQSAEAALLSEVKKLLASAAAALASLGQRVAVSRYTGVVGAWRAPAGGSGAAARRAGSSEGFSPRAGKSGGWR